MRILSVLFLFFMFSQVIAEPKALKPRQKEVSQVSLKKIDETSAILVPHFGIKLYLFPDTKSDVIKILKFGEKIVYDKETLEETSDKWIPVRTEEGLTGHVIREVVLSIPKHQCLNRLIFEADKLLSKKSTSLYQRMEITDSLFQVATNGEYTGDEFVLSRTKAGYGLKRTLDSLNEKKIKPDTSAELLDFLKRHQSKLLYDYSDSVYYVDPNYFWKLIEVSPNTKHADYAAYLAAEVLPAPDCKKDLACELETIRKSKMRYIYQFPNGNYVSIYFKDIIAKLKDITKDPDAIACYKPLPVAIQSEIGTMSRYIQEYSVRHRREIQPYIKILQDECLY